MNPHLRSRLFGKVPRGLVGMIPLILLVESLIAYHHLDFTRFYIHDWSAAGTTARERSRGCTLLCFGDSLVKFGVLPRVIQDQTGDRVYNLSVCGGQAASSYFLLRRALEAQSKPSAVLVDYAPHLLAAGPRHNLRQWPELVSLGEAVELGLASRHAGFCAELTLRWLFPSIKVRDEVRGNIIASLKGKDSSRRDDVLAHRRIWDENLGADVHPERPSYRGEVDVTDRGYFPRKWSCHPVNEHFIGRFLDLAATRDIRVVWLLPPVVPKFQAQRDDLGLETTYTMFLKALAAKYPHLSILDSRHAGYDPTLFVDPLHLNRRGAETLSTEIATALPAMLGAGSAPRRWVDLAEFRTRPAGVLLTDHLPSSVPPGLPSKGRRR